MHLGAFYPKTLPKNLSCHSVLISLYQYLFLANATMELASESLGMEFF